MSLGSESDLYMKHATGSTSREASGNVLYETFDTDSDPIEDASMNEIDVHDISTPGKRPPKPPQNNLMSLLSGNRGAKKEKIQKRLNVTEFKEHKEQILPISDSKVTSLSDPSDVPDTSSDVPDTSFNAYEFEKNAEEAKAIEELEKKAFSSGRSISLKDFLKKSKPVSLVLDAENGNDEECIITDTAESFIAAPDVIAVDDEPEESEKTEKIHVVEDLEMLFPASKSVNARNLFDSFGPKRIKKSNGDWSLKVRLRISPDKLASIKRFEDPMKMRGNTSLDSSNSGNSMISALMRKKSTTKVTIRLPIPFLRSIAKSANPFFTESSGARDGKDANNVFAMMMKTASRNSPKLTAIQKLKELHPSPIPRYAMHVIPELEPSANPRMIELPARKPHSRYPNLSVSSMDDLTKELSSEMQDVNLDNPSLRYDKCQIQNIEQLIKTNAPLALTSLPHARVVEKFIQKKSPHAGSLNWPQRFQPKSLESLLMSQGDRQFLKRWMSNAFSVLKTQSTKVPRNVKLKEQQKRQRKREASMLDFIVDDFEEDEDVTDEDVFVPILVIQGDSGSCKSASVYAAMAAMDGYVHEINTGQARSRKDIQSSLREFCTTQIIHQRSEDKKFQKGLVLFEDCDILFEQDRSFWSMVQEVINYSRRPIVVTVQDISVVPRNILELAEEQSSILSLKASPEADVNQYLWLCALSENKSLAPEILQRVSKECQTESGIDLRKALMSCQWLCRAKPHNSEIVELSYAHNTPETNTAHDLGSIVKKLDALSVSDVLESNSHSLISHDVVSNELLDIYMLDESLRPRQRTLPHELNTGKHIQELIPRMDIPSHSVEIKFNDLRRVVLDFIASRAKKVPKFIQELYSIRVQTRSRSSDDFVEEYPETQGIPDTSTCYSMSPMAFILDLAPIARYWASFQKGIISLDKQSSRPARSRGIVDFLGWRMFHDKVDEVLTTTPHEM